MLIAAVVLSIIVTAVGLRALPRSLAEILVDALYAAAQRAYALACAADAALVRYRTVRAEVTAAHQPHYAEVA